MSAPVSPIVAGLDHTTVQLSWLPVAADAVCTTGYTVAINSTSTNDVLTHTIANTTTYNITVVPNNKYMFKVAAVDVSGTTGTYSISVSINYTGWLLKHSYGIQCDYE